MEKVIKIGEQDVKVKSSAAIPHIYRRRFGRDIFVDMGQIMKKFNPDKPSEITVDSLEIFENLAYCFARHAAPEEVPDDIEVWLEQFEIFDIYNALPEIFDMWIKDNHTTGRLKKNNDK